MPSLFISYRRSDAQQASLGLYFQLRSRLGSKGVFMDRSGIAAGDVWPQRLRRALEEATVVLAVIGPGWLTAADQYGRRRIDMADDWVRTEILHALESGKPIVPLLVSPVTDMPPAEGLPGKLISMRRHHALTLRDDHWESDVNELVRLLTGEYGFREADRPVRLPRPEVRPAALTEAELDAALASLPGWERVESLIPGDYPKSREEIRRAYDFKSFPAAIDFMSRAVEPIKQAQHHPRWENQWRTVTVYLSTWDIGLRVSRLDIDLAARLDAVYAEQKAAARGASS